MVQEDQRFPGVGCLRTVIGIALAANYAGLASMVIIIAGLLLIGTGVLNVFRYI